MSICNFTARDNFSVALFGYGAQTHSYSEILSSKNLNRELRSFCQNWTHKMPEESLKSNLVQTVFRVKGLSGMAFEVKSKRNESTCECGHALFWSRSYTRYDMNAAHVHARRLADAIDHKDDFFFYFPMPKQTEPYKPKVLTEREQAAFEEMRRKFEIMALKNKEFEHYLDGA